MAVPAERDPKYLASENREAVSSCAMVLGLPAMKAGGYAEEKIAAVVRHVGGHRKYIQYVAVDY